MQIKIMQFTASFAWPRNNVNHGHAACDNNAEWHESHVEMEGHGLESLNLEVEKTMSRGKR